MEEEKSKKEGETAKEGSNDIDTDLDKLLDDSLNEFGKHVPASAGPSGGEGGVESKLGRGLSRVDDTEDPTLKELEKVFGEEIAAQVEGELNEAVKLLSTENPELFKQFESFAESLTQEGMPAPPPQPTPPPRTKGSLEVILEETVRRIQGGGASSEGDIPPKLASMMSDLQLGDFPDGDGTEDGIMAAMQGMMNTLLSKEVLYPSLLDFCNQYPDWLQSHEEKLSPEDKERYMKQYEIMKTICGEFEKETTGEEEESQKQENILQLMQQLQDCGQPPDDLGGGPIQPPLLGPDVLQSPSNEQCSVM